MGRERDVLAVSAEVDPEELFGRIGSDREPERLRVHVVVPATAPRFSWTYTEGGAKAEARARLGEILMWARARGFRASGEVGDSNPCVALADAIRRRRFDRVVVVQRPSLLDRLASLKPWYVIDRVCRAGRGKCPQREA